MTYKTFSFRSGFGAWSNTEGTSATLIGGFYGYKTPKTFRNIKVVKLVEKLPTKIEQDTWFIQTDADTIQRALKLTQHDAYYQRPELIIQGTNRRVESITPYMSASND